MSEFWDNVKDLCEDIKDSIVAFCKHLRAYSTIKKRLKSLKPFQKKMLSEFIYRSASQLHLAYSRDTINDLLRDSVIFRPEGCHADEYCFEIDKRAVKFLKKHPGLLI